MMNAKDLNRAQAEYGHWVRLDQAQVALQRAKDKKVVTLHLDDPTGLYLNKAYPILLPVEEVVRILRQKMAESRERLASLGVSGPYPTEVEDEDATSPAADDPRWLPGEAPQ